MKHRAILVAALLPALACTPKGEPSAAGSSGDPKDAEIEEVAEVEAPAADRERAERAFDRVRRSQRAGFIDHDLDAYMAAFADDAELIIGRGPEPGPYDVVLDHASLRASKAVRFAAPKQPDLEMTHELLGHELVDDKLILRVLSTTGTPDWPEIMNETYVLEDRGAGDVIVENRAWPKALGRGREALAFSPEVWARHDANMAQLIESKQFRAAREAALRHLDLLNARRMAEQIVRQPDAEASDWLALAYARLFTGSVEDAAAAAVRAGEFDPELDLGLFASQLDQPPK